MLPEPRPVLGGGLRLEDELAGRDDRPHRRGERLVDDRGAGSGERGHDAREMGPERRLRQVKKLRRDREPRRSPGAHRDRATRQDALHERRVGDGPGERPGVVEGRAERQDAVERHVAVVALQPDDPAERRGPQDRPDRLCPDCDRHVTSRDGGRRSRRGAAGRVVEGPRVARAGRVAIGERRRDGLADDDGPRGPEPCDEGRVAVGAGVCERRPASGRRHTGDVDDVLDPDRDAVERPGLAAARAFVVAETRLGSGGVTVHGRPRPDRGVRGRDPGEARLEELAGGGPAGPDGGDRVGDAEIRRVGRARHRRHRPRSEGRPGRGDRGARYLAISLRYLSFLGEMRHTPDLWR